MKQKRRCASINSAGAPCGAAPLMGAEHCLVHDPAHREEMAEWRRMGGLHRRREASLTTIYELGDIQSTPGLWRIFEIGVLDTLALENSLGRNRLLINAAGEGGKLLDRDDLYERVSDIEAVLGPRLPRRGKQA